MCPPRFYGVNYVINPWMEGNIGRVNAELAARQWEGLREALVSRANIQFADPVEGLPDMPFTANAGLVLGDIAIPARFRFPQRQPESRHFAQWFRERGLRVIEIHGQGTFEGEGDALFQPGQALLWGGYGVRTSLLAHREIAGILNVEVLPLRLVDERFYHLDTCFCPLREGRVIYYPGAFDKESLELIQSRVGENQRFEVTSEDALQFACNAIATGKSFITNYASQGLRAKLSEWGYEVLACPLGEFIMAGGSAKCLVLRLSNSPPKKSAGNKVAVTQAIPVNR